ncbi:MAG: hypothetical protein ACON35_01235 [Candidatus Marinamargulisbacteria bacterium]
MNSININNFKNLGSNPFRIREKRDLQNYYNKRWGKNTLPTPSDESILKTTQTNKPIQKTIENEFSKRKSLTQSDLRDECSSIESSSSDVGIFELELELDDHDAKFDYKRDRDNELEPLYQNRECEVSNSQQDEIVCLLTQGHDSHNINSALSNLEDYNLRSELRIEPSSTESISSDDGTFPFELDDHDAKFDYKRDRDNELVSLYQNRECEVNNSQQDENKSPDNVMAIVDIEGEYPLATIGSSNKNQSPVNEISSARLCTSPPIIIDQTALAHPRFNFEAFDIKLREEVHNLRLSPGSKMMINTTIGEIRKHAYLAEPVIYDYMNGKATIYDVASFILNILGTKEAFIKKINEIESKSRRYSRTTIENTEKLVQAIENSKKYLELT